MSQDQIITLKDFNIINTISDGLFGTVYLVEDKSTHKQYAAKVSKQECISEEDQKEFAKNVILFSKINNPSILNLVGYNLRNFDDKPFPTTIADRLINGPLEEVFINDRKGTLEQKLTRPAKYIILLGIAFGMKHLHSHGIVHRNLQPQYILLDQDFAPHISDLTFSDIKDSQLTDMLIKSNTTLYISPEVFDGKPYSYKSDVYSFSLIAYELVTGKKPYGEYSTFSEFREAVIQGKRPDLSVIPNGKVRAFLSECWSVNPRDRPSFSKIIDEITNYRYKIIFRTDEAIEKVGKYLNFFRESDQIKGNYLNDQAKEIKAKADAGDPQTMFLFASMLRDGEGAPIDKSEAARYFSLSSSLGNTDAMYKYAVMLRDGDGVSVDKATAAVYFKKSADSGNVNAMNNYGVMLCDGDGVSVDKKEAATYIKKSADLGNPNAMNNYANMLRNGEGVSVDKKEAALLFKKAADLGNSSAMFNYAGMLLEGSGIQRNKDEEVKYVKMAAELGNDYAMYNFAVMNRDGEGVDVNKALAEKYFRICAEAGNPNAMFNLAGMLHEGDGIEINKEEAAKLYKEAADLGNVNAMLNYAGILHTGDGVPVDDKLAEMYVRKAAESGDENALMILEVSGCSIS